jgi:hypothetical protein
MKIAMLQKIGEYVGINEYLIRSLHEPPQVLPSTSQSLEFSW